jgi:hypothetical protein
METVNTTLAEAQIRQLIDEFSAAVMARDLDRMLASYAKDASSSMLRRRSYRLDQSNTGHTGGNSSTC